ncbi:MAG: PIG-L deacetylase family protein [Pyrinomonadaceae bacterium]
MSNLEILSESPLADISTLPMQDWKTISDWGKTLVIAPHPDDESLGCGGTIALLRELQQEVKILVLSDGTLSHPNSAKFPPAKLRDLRETEMLAALEILGVSGANATFFRYCDRSIPNEESSEFGEAVERCRRYLEEIQPQTILVPWRRDPHPDHRAAYALLNAADENKSRIIEYPIWLWEIAQDADAPRFDEVKAWRLDIEKVSDKKQKAIRAHASQTTDLIDDDPKGFRLTPEILANFDCQWEVYLEPIR